jgi:hypothetical protein
MSDPIAVSRRLVAVFAADVEAYSRLMGADEVGTLKGQTERRAILDRLIGEHKGPVANIAGSSVPAEFSSACDVRAVRLRLFVRVCRSVDGGAARFCHWCADPFCLENLLCEFALRVDRDKAAPQILMLGSTASRSRAVVSADFSARMLSA